MKIIWASSAKLWLQPKPGRKPERQRDIGQGQKLFPASSAALWRVVNESWESWWSTAFMAHGSHNHVTILCSEWSFWLLLWLPVGSHRVLQPPPHDYIKHRQDEWCLFVLIHDWLTFAVEGHIPLEDNIRQCNTWTFFQLDDRLEDGSNLHIV